MYMGDYIQIEKQVSKFEYIISSVSTGTTVKAVIDTDKREIELPNSWKNENPHACSFLRPQNSKVLCILNREKMITTMFLPYP